MKKAVVTHFPPNVITEAKHAICQHPLCESVVGPIKQRRKSDLEVDDILDALDAIDDNGVELGFIIPAQELDRLPALNPAALLPAAILERMEEMEHRMNAMQTTLSQVMADNQALRGAGTSHVHLISNECAKTTETNGWASPACSAPRPV